MRIYWYGDGKMLRIRLTSAVLPQGTMTMEAFSTLARDLGFPVLLDWSSGLDDGEGVAVFGIRNLEAVPPPGREDLESDSLVVWVRASAVAGLFFTKALADTAAMLAVITTYMKAFNELTDLGHQAMELRSERAEIVVSSGIRRSSIAGRPEPLVTPYYTDELMTNNGRGSKRDLDSVSQLS